MSGDKKSKRREPKLQAKRTRPLEKAWYILRPFVVYTVWKTAAILLFDLIVVSIPSTAASDWITANSNQVNAVINALASLIAVLFILNDFLKEVAVSGEVDIDSSIFRQLISWIRTGFGRNKDKMLQLAAVISLAITSSLTFNILIEMLQVQSQKYQEVEAIQYSVPVWLGIILYGLVSPFVEEVVFRGLTYNRMKRYFGIPLCVITTSLLFAGFHANLVQFMYASCMGVLMALCYEWVGCFAAPFLFHLTANVFVFILSDICDGITALVSPLTVIVFGILSAVILFCLYLKRIPKREQ